MLSQEQNAALSELESHPSWPLRLCAVTNELGEPAVDPDLFYTPGAANESAAKKVCLSGCPLLADCRMYALGGNGWWESDGVWGGMTADERRTERRARQKRRARLARQGDERPQPVENWEPSPAQVLLLQALAKEPDLRAAAEAMDRPFPNVRWVYAQMCEQLGFHQDELTVPALLKEAAARISGDPPSGPVLEVAA
ncbi:WhiB family transcriptional regulator [Streptomyces scabiei]|uniref:WhiB family transcriptional regulator n=1 Tax=Streptomyces scabiei TaxID=1930 RepID=UPI0029B15650|nr:WhiB family transcriptional regulator [Streptomyces scabiei]MDX3165974.1 WhiB family transcriptional regulator [Streptomyces scabiei]